MFLYSSFLSTLTNKIKKHTHTRILSPFGVKLELHMYELISKYKRMTLIFITACLHYLSRLLQSMYDKLATNVSIVSTQHVWEVLLVSKAKWKCASNKKKKTCQCWGSTWVLFYFKHSIFCSGSVEKWRKSWCVKASAETPTFTLLH